jgi:2'-5' RNA ligase
VNAQRLFVAVDLPRYAVDHLAGAVAGLHAATAKAGLAAAERWHVTVVFLGNVVDDRVARVHRALARAAAGPGARPVTLRVAGGGMFRGRGGAVLWAGVAGDVVGLTRLARAVKRELRQERFTLESRRYQPHLTIARPGDRLSRDLLGVDVATLAGYQGPEWTVEEIHLVRSFLGPKPRHERVASFRLAAAAPADPATAD